MKILVVGCGSIGKRHIENLQRLYYTDIIAYDSNPDVIIPNVEMFKTLQLALLQKPDATIICTPPSSHIPIAYLAAELGCNLFIEKPLSNTLEGIDELEKAVKRKKLITMVGCNMRFHRGISEIKTILDNQIIGKVICARVQAGYYLPDWHPDKDYRKEYSASKKLGGGIILDGVHELDYLRWFFGLVEKVTCISSKFSSLEIDTEDMAEILLKFESGVIAEVHLDYIQRAYKRDCQIIGEEGTIYWDYTENQVKVYNTEWREWQSSYLVPQTDSNQMYIDEMKHFLYCVENKLKTCQDIYEAKHIVNVALAAKDSSRLGEEIILTQ